MGLGIGFGLSNMNWGRAQGGGSVADDRFIISVKTDNAGSSNDNQFTIPWIGTYDVDWGDGTVDTAVVDTQTHTYASAGTYDISITADSGRIFFNNGGDKDKLLAILNWGSCAWTSFEKSFSGCWSLNYVDSNSYPDLSNVESLNEAFSICAILGLSQRNMDWTKWDVSNVLTFGSRFLSRYQTVVSDDYSGWRFRVGANISGAVRDSRRNILTVSNWDLSNLTSLNRVFSGRVGNTIIGLGTWDISVINDLSSMFAGCNASSLGDFSNWDTSNVTTMQGMFFGYGAIINDEDSINSINNLDVSNVTNMQDMFGYGRYIASIPTIDLSNWDTSKVTTMRGMFASNSFTKFSNTFLNNWDITSVTNFIGFMNNSDCLTVEHYDETLISWAAQTPQNNINISFGSSQYSYEGRAARQSLIDNFGWTIVDGGEAVMPEFAFTVKTDNAGTSGTNQFTIPTSTSGITQAFLYDIETSDGQTITGLTGDHTITFPSAGEYEVKISGSFPYMRFNRGGDRFKMLDIKNFGIYALGSTSQISAFNGCSNMTITATDSGNFGSVTNFQYAWSECSSLTSFPLIDTSSGSVFRDAWRFCTSLANYPANAFDSNIATDYFRVFGNTNLTTQSIDDILVSLDTSGVSNGTFTQSGGQAPSATGEAAIDSLVGRGWTITVTGGYTPPQLLLDQYPNSAAAYSLRELSTAFVGQPVVRVRRSSDNTEQDFTATEITDGTLTTFTGANDGFVTTWYDQSGNSNNVIQASATRQPKIVENGVLNIDNGKPYLLYDGGYVVLEANNTGIISNNGSIFATYNSSDTNAGILLNSYGASLGFMILNSNDPANTGAFTSATHYTNGNTLTGTTRGDFYNSRVLGQDVLTTTLNVTGNMLNNYIQPYAYEQVPQLSAICKAKEFIIYPSDQSANRTGIENNINTEYTIY